MVQDLHGAQEPVIVHAVRVLACTHTQVHNQPATYWVRRSAACCTSSNEGAWGGGCAMPTRAAEGCRVYVLMLGGVQPTTGGAKLATPTHQASQPLPTCHNHGPLDVWVLGVLQFADSTGGVLWWEPAVLVQLDCLVAALEHL